MRFLFAILGTIVLAAAMPPSGALAAGEGEGSSKSILPDWFNRHNTEYFTMPPFVVPVIYGNTVSRQVTLLVTIETTGVDNKGKIVENRQRLQDAFLRDIYGVLSIQEEDRNSRHSDAIRIRLRRVGNRILGPGVIDKILVKTTYNRQIAPSR
jgi:hypothetical protein